MCHRQKSDEFICSERTKQCHIPVLSKLLLPGTMARGRASLILHQPEQSHHLLKQLTGWAQEVNSDEIPECRRLEFLLGKHLDVSLLPQLTGTPCEDGRAVGLRKNEDERPAGGTNEEVEAQNPKPGSHRLST
jgi:hypothetical protein